MKLKRLAFHQFDVVAIMDGDECPAEKFLLDGEESTEAARMGLIDMLETVAADGLQNVPHAWFHEANKQLKIYEFIKGPLRLFFFKGSGGQIAVCTCGVRKSGKKADPKAVKKAAKWRDDYYAALKNGTLILESEDGA